MKKTMYAVFFLLFTTLLFAQDSTEKLTYGEISGNTYINSYFRLSAPIPEGWDIQSEKAMKYIIEEGKNIFVGDDKNMKTLVDASEDASANLFAVFKYKLGAKVSFNPSIICIADKTDNYPSVKTGDDYLLLVKKLLVTSQTKLDYTFGEKTTSQKIDGIPFDVLDAKLTIGNAKITQKVYAAIIKGYALGFITSSADNEQAKELLAFINNISFGKDQVQKSSAAPAASDAPKK
jgi:hypothetical protein